MQYHPKRAALVNDLTGFGRCSLTIGLPVISAMGIQGCPVPTAVLSNHVGFDRFFFKDLTEHLPAYLAEWDRLGVSFDGIYTGFLGSKDQIDIVVELIKRAKPDVFIFVDPVMGEDGLIPAPYTDELCLEMRRLVALADVITPNLTEAARLCDLDYDPAPSDSLLHLMGDRLLSLGCHAAIITGIQRENRVGSLVIESGKPPEWVWNRLCGQPRVGTGDLFGSIVFGSVLQGRTVLEGAQRAAAFLETVLEFSDRQQIPIMDGICFEPFLSQLGGSDEFKI